MSALETAIAPAIGDARFTVVCDFLEEQWPSMDLAADMLVEQARSMASSPDRVAVVRPEMRRIVGELPGLVSARAALNANRLLNRFVMYPRHLRAAASTSDLFHVVDHSYAHLVHALPAERTGVFCHDLDAFACLLDPAGEPKPAWFRAMARRILVGLQKAAVVFYSTEAVRRQIERHSLVESGRLVRAPYGISGEFRVEGEPDSTVLDDFGIDRPFVLHVGSCIPRKRIDVLLDVFARVCRTRSDLLLVHAGGDWTDEQRRQMAELGIEEQVRTLSLGQSRETIAELYRRASVVLIPSEAEGFGLPMIEALACGAIVVASDIPPLREVGGDAGVLCPVADLDAWSECVGDVLDRPASAPDLATRLARARLYSWSAHAETILSAYRRHL